MPTNLPAEAKAKWVKYLEARTLEEKIEALEEFLSYVPKHKGTENLRAWVRRKIAELKDELEEKKARRGGGGGPTFFIEKEGAAQVVMLGFTKSGKSSVLRILTNAKPEVSPIPFTTTLPVPGMMPYQDIQIQVIEAPAFVNGMSKGSVWWGSRVLGLARNADGLIVVLDAANDPIEQFKSIVEELAEVGIHVRKPSGEVSVIKSRDVHGIRVITYGRLINCTSDDVRKLLESYRIYNAEVRVFGEVTLDDIEKAIFERITYKPTLVLLNKVDLIDGEQVSEVLTTILSGYPDIQVLPVSAAKRLGFDNVPEKVFKMLKIIRVYTKEPNSERPSPKPMILKEGATVEEAIKKIREEFLKYFKFAKIWGPSAKYPGERVGLDHILMDGDVIEIRTTIKGV